MNHRFAISTLMVILLLVTGCTPATVSNQPTATVNPAFLQDTPVAGPITLEMLKNAKYQAQNGMTLVQLVDGKYEAGSGVDYISVNLIKPTAFGDLNNDGRQDAAVILVENYGGTGSFVYLVPVFDNSGSVSPSSGFFLGDRVVVQSMEINGGVIKLGLLTHGPSDGLCCPRQEMTQSFRFYWGPGLVMVNATQVLDNGTKREISIDGPAAGSTVSSPFQLTGNVSIAPFENTLRLQVFDSSNMLVYSGSIMVNSTDVGTPATFNATVDLSASNVKPGPIRVELAELSMADGSLLDLDSVDLVLK